MRFTIFFLSFFLPVLAWSGEIQYNASSIPEDLKRDANVVKRYEEIRFEIVSGSETILRKKFALTILNEKGSRHTSFYEFYDKMRKITSLEGSLYDAHGMLIKKARAKEFQDVSAIDDNNLIDDSRVKVHEFFYKTYPYTVEYEVEIRFNNSYVFPNWIPQRSENYSVERSSFTVVAPKDYTLRYKSFNYQGEPSTTFDKNKKITMWSTGQLKPIRNFSVAPRWIELTTTVFLAPSSFEMEGFKGDATTWESIGKFQIALNQGRDKLPDGVQEKVKEITAGLSTDQQKVAALYKYLQKNTRYISIQLGIGGLQPFDASFVAKKGYGDCKALSNYMYSLLKAAGIKSYYSWVRAGASKDDTYVMEDFPSDQFNHIILCVPVQQDTIWLECTSQTESAGYMGSFTGNRKALLITETGGKLVSTPHYKLADNLQERRVKGVLTSEGDLELNVFSIYKGTQQDYRHQLINNLSKEKVKSFLNEELNFSTYEIQDFQYKEKQQSLPEVEEQLNIFVNNYATASGKRLFVNPNLINRSSLRFTEEEKRTCDYVFDKEFKHVDSIELQIPEGYRLEAVPADIDIKTKFGLYSSRIKVAGNKLFYVRVREQYAGRFSIKEQEELSRFFEMMYKADRNRLVFVRES